MLEKCKKCGEFYIMIGEWDYTNFTPIKLSRCPICGRYEIVKTIEPINPNEDERFYIYNRNYIN